MSNATNFSNFKSLFDNNKIFELLKHNNAILWLKLRAISRKELLNNFIKQNNINIKSTKASDIFEELFNIIKDEKLIDNFIKNNLNILDEIQEQKLVSELYKIKYFDWGGDYKNALDRYIVDRYIKKYDSYDEIVSKLDNEIAQAVSGYVKCSWYNHWTTILIENIFKNHKNVLSAIGEIKQIDFFIKDIPFDLKTTYLPTNFIESERKKAGLTSELQAYKNIAKKHNIIFDKIAKDPTYEIKEKAINQGVNEINNIDNFKKDLLKNCIENPQKLIQNLYEEQGEMRFDASNRIFLILVDVNNFDDSWKLKRDINLLKNNIHSYLDNFNKSEILNNPITFKYKFKSDEVFKVYSDCIFIIKGEL